MKKILSVLISIVFAFSITTTMFATDIENTARNAFFKSLTDFQGQIITSYQSHEKNTVISTDRNAVKRILSNLGMEDSFIDKLSDEQLELYASADQFIGITMYTAAQKN